MSQTGKLLNLMALTLIVLNLREIPVVINGRSIEAGEMVILDGSVDATIIIEDGGVNVYGVK